MKECSSSLIFPSPDLLLLCTCVCTCVCSHMCEAWASFPPLPHYEVCPSLGLHFPFINGGNRMGAGPELSALMLRDSVLRGERKSIYVDWE